MTKKPASDHTEPRASRGAGDLVAWLEHLGRDDVGRVGGKNSSLGEMISKLRQSGIRVPGGFATTAAAYWAFVDHNQLREPIGAELQKAGRDPARAGKAIRRLLLRASFPEPLRRAILDAYAELGRRNDTAEPSVAVRSSATAEDLPQASFAGQQESFLNVHGDDELLAACQRCYASLFTDRAIAYRAERGFDHLQVALSIGVQVMVRADRAGAGVAFTLDPDSGFPGVVVIDAAWGLGESVVQGAVTPDEYTVFKGLLDRAGLRPIVGRTLGSKERKVVYARKGGSEPTRWVDTTRKERQSLVLDDDEVLQLARWCCAIERHYGTAMDVEWAKDGDSGELYVVQARPETVQSRKARTALETHRLLEQGDVVCTGLAVGQGIASGKAQVLRSAEEIDRFEPGSILVTGMTDPDWGPVLKQARAIVTDHGGRTSHAAIVSRELGIPAVVGTGDATSAIGDGDEVTVSCAEGEQGKVYAGALRFESTAVEFGDLPKTRTEVMINVASPAASFRWWDLPADGVGLARMEFLVQSVIQVHPMALAHLDEVEDRAAAKQIRELLRGRDPCEYFVAELAQGIAKLAAPWHRKPVIVRTSDFKTNEYAELIGGRQWEPQEQNPMLGWRGASRYYSAGYRDGFALECRALRRVREEIGLDNVVVMIPFCRTVEEADRVLATMAEHGLVRGERGLQVYVMAEIPSNVILAEEFAKRFDGFSIGSNDLTQLVLGVDRDSEPLAPLFDERNPAVKWMIRHLIEVARRTRTKVGICGQAPSDHPDFAAFLVECGIDSISVIPDSVIDVRRRVAESEAKGSGPVLPSPS